jgi:hypothetical protein
MDETKNPVGRPSDYTQELANKICSKLSEGISLRTVCLADDMPDKSTVFDWLATKKEFAYQYACAKEQGTEAMNELLLDLGDEAIELAQSVNDKASSAVVQAVKLKADNLKWVMSKMKPKKYGDKLDLTTDGEKLPAPIYGGNSITE